MAGLPEHERTGGAKMTESEFERKLNEEGYTEQEISFAKKSYLVGKVSAILEMMEMKVEKQEILRQDL